MEKYNFKGKIEYKLFKNIKSKKETKRIKIFDEEFVKNNESNFKIIYNGQELCLTSFLELSEAKENNKIEIILQQVNQVTNISKMFFECENLYLFPGLGKLNIENITDISSLFRNCINILKIPDISNWNTSKVNNMSYLFSGCKNIFSLPDIAKWDTSNVTNLSYMFMGCNKISELPDISKWNTSKCIKMNNMFQGCSKLVKLPDINLWDVSGVINMSNMFYGCALIQTLPDISIWNVKNVENMSSMFSFCTGLNILPDLDKWDISNLKTKSLMFAMCKSTLNYPAFLNKNNQKKITDNSNTNINSKIEIKKNINIKSEDTIQAPAQESKEFFCGKSYLCCPKCKDIPKILLKNNNKVLLSCEFCGFDEKINISELFDDKPSNWISKVFYNCNCKLHKDTNKKILANKYCLICDSLLCQKCEAVHNGKYKDERHELDEILDLDIHFCEKHSSKIINFCVTCNEYICDYCLKCGHESHKIIDKDKKNELNINFIKNYQQILSQGKHSKIHILNKIEENFDKNEIEKKYQTLQLFKNDIKEVDNFKKLGKILYFSSKKIKSEKYEKELLDNYYIILNSIAKLFSQKSIKKFKHSIQEKIDEIKFVSQSLNKEEKEFLIKSIKKIFEPIPPGFSDFYKKKAFIENNIDFSRILKKYIIIEKNKNPDNYIDMDDVLYNSDNISERINSNDPEFILSLIGKCAQNNGTEVYITKKSNEEFKNIESASIQSLFSLGNQKKYILHFNFQDKIIEQILESREMQKDFIESFKPLISKELDDDYDNLIFRDIHRGSLGVTCTLVESSEKTDNLFPKLKGQNNIEEVEEKPLLEALQISPNILDPEGNRSTGWGMNETRGGEKYIPPLKHWRGIGLKVSGKYDNGNDNWLNYKNKKGEFAIAYMGINNFLGNQDEMISDLNLMLMKKLFRKELDCRNNEKGEEKKCGDGICLFQNPEYAENSAGIINVYGYQIKVLLMCRINPEKIRQPYNFRDFWILNPTPDEIRPYRILIKIIPNSPFTDGSYLTISKTPVDYILNILKSNDTSFFDLRDKYTKKLLEIGENDEFKKINAETKKKYNEYNALTMDSFIIKLYTDNLIYQTLNNYLRDLKNFKEDQKFPSEHIPSYIFCLVNSLTRKEKVKDGTVKDGTKVYRGVSNFKLEESIGIGSGFYFREFTSTTLSKRVAYGFIDKKGTLFSIIITNNERRYYCSDITSDSQYKYEKEILISPLCHFIVIKIKRNKNGIDKVKLLCEGFLLDKLLKNDTKKENDNKKENDTKKEDENEKDNDTKKEDENEKDNK